MAKKLKTSKVKKVEKKVVKAEKIEEIEKDPIRKEPIAVEVEQKEILWVTVAFEDGTLWKFPAAMIIRKAQALGKTIKNTDKAALLEYATKSMGWTEVQMKAVGLERESFPDYKKEWAIATKDVIYG